MWRCAAANDARQGHRTFTPYPEQEMLVAESLGHTQRRGVRRAIVAVARHLAVVLHRMWVDGSEFRWREDSTALPAVA